MSLDERESLLLGRFRPALAVRVGALTIAVKEHDHLGGAVDCGERVGSHRVELGGLAGLDGDAPPTEHEQHPPLEHEEPVVADVDPLRGLGGGGIEPHLDRRGGRRRTAEHPSGAFRRPGGHWPDDYVAVVGARQQRVEIDLQGAGEGQQYIEAKGAPPRLHPADGRGAEVGAYRQLVERQAEGRPQTAQALTDQAVDLVGRGLRQGLLANSARYHAFSAGPRYVRAMSDHGTANHPPAGPAHGDHEHANPAPAVMQRRCDVAVVGVSAVALAVAQELARRHLTVIAVEPEPAGGPLEAQREAARRHGVEVIAGRAVDVSAGHDGRQVVELTGGHTLIARRVLDATVPAGGIDLTAVDPLAAQLAQDDRRAAAQPAANQADWDGRYGGDRLWSGNPNGTLVTEVAGLSPGRALDVGAGEGGDALWLAERGWQVTASDVSPVALARIATEAERRGLHVDRLHVDANATDAFEPASYDLVSAFYAAIPRTPDNRAVANLLAAVAPGGVLLVVSHDLAAMRIPIDTAVTSRPFDPDAFVRVDDVAVALAGAAGWRVEVLETRPRPAGATAASHHVDDMVLRARRSAT